MGFREYPATRMMEELEADNLLPAILFRSSRASCDGDVKALAQRTRGNLSFKKQREIKDVVRQVIEKYDFNPELIYEHPQFNALVLTGAGAHHAGQLLMWRLLLEELMSKGLLRLMVATGTVAAGVDFPARTVIITAHSRRGSDGFQVLSSSEFQQMSGRAGRRGRDAVGICLIAPSAFSDARLIAKVAKQPPEPLKSSYFAAPSTVLNLLRYRNVDDLRFTVDKSLASFLDRKNATSMRDEAYDFEKKISSQEKEHTEHQQKKYQKRVKRELRQADELEAKQNVSLELALDGLKALGHLDGGALTEKGYWSANLCTSLVLYIAEAIDKGIFKDAGEVEVIGFLAAISGDSYKTYLNIKQNPIAKKDFEKLKEVVLSVTELYKGPQSVSDVTVMPDAALTVLIWSQTEDWLEFASLLRLAGIAEGDAARLIMQTADHLNQIIRLMDTHSDLAKTAELARMKLVRPPLSEVVAKHVE